MVRPLQQQKDQKLESNYQFNLILRKRSEIILNRLENGVQKGLISSELAENSLKYHQLSQEQANNRLQTLTNRNPSLNHALQKRIIKQVVLVQVEEKLEEKVYQGVINQEMCEKISEDISQSITRL